MSKEGVFMDTKAKLAEHFDEYLIIVRNEKGGLRWRFSDGTFALGAAQRLATCLLADDQMSRRVPDDNQEGGDRERR